MDLLSQVAVLTVISVSGLFVLAWKLFGRKDCPDCYEVKVDFVVFGVCDTCNGTGRVPRFKSILGRK